MTAPVVQGPTRWPKPRSDGGWLTELRPKKRGVLLPCLFCRIAAKPEADPRLPLLRVHACEPCRNWIARSAGWRPVQEGPRFRAGRLTEQRFRAWRRGDETVTLKWVRKKEWAS